MVWSLRRFQFRVMEPQQALERSPFSNDPIWEWILIYFVVFFSLFLWSLNHSTFSRRLHNYSRLWFSRYSKSGLFRLTHCSWCSSSSARFTHGECYFKGVCVEWAGLVVLLEKLRGVLVCTWISVVFKPSKSCSFEYIYFLSQHLAKTNTVIPYWG